MVVVVAAAVVERVVGLVAVVVQHLAYDVAVAAVVAAVAAIVVAEAAVVHLSPGLADNFALVVELVTVQYRHHDHAEPLVRTATEFRRRVVLHEVLGEATNLLVII